MLEYVLQFKPRKEPYAPKSQNENDLRSLMDLIGEIERNDTRKKYAKRLAKEYDATKSIDFESIGKNESYAQLLNQMSKGLTRNFNQISRGIEKEYALMSDAMPTAELAEGGDVKNPLFKLLDSLSQAGLEPESFLTKIFGQDIELKGFDDKYQHKVR